jgi:predicted metal-binding membrane protein
MLYDAREFSRIRNVAFALSALAWLLLLLPMLFAPASDMTQYHAGHAAHMHMEAAISSAPQSKSYLPAALDWLLMLVAMMAPMLPPAIYRVRTSSFERRRGRSTLLFVAGYAGVWILAGGILLTLAEAQRAMALPPYSMATLVFALALVWQCSPFKQRCLNRCHDQAPLAAFGRAADRDALRFGGEQGMWCVGSCWMWMLLPLLLPQGHVAAMALVTVLVFCERLERPQALRWRWRGFGRATRVLALRINSLMPARTPLSPV